MEAIKRRFAKKVPCPMCGPKDVMCSECKGTRKIRDPFYFAPTFHPERLDAPLAWKKPRIVMVNIAGELFSDAITNREIRLVLDVMYQCPQHTFLVPTKRYQRMGHLLPLYSQGAMSHVFPLPSVCNQAMMDEAAPHILRLCEAGWPVVILAEPLLGAVDVRAVLPLGAAIGYELPGMPPITPGIRGVVSGFQAGPKAQPGHPQWARDLRDQCAGAEIAFCWKGWGEWIPASIERLGGDHIQYHPIDGHSIPENYTSRSIVGWNGDEATRKIADWCPTDWRSYRVGHTHSGRLVDGVLHDRKAWDE
jgi:protein gp37